jgi:hypothetical protein
MMGLWRRLVIMGFRERLEMMGLWRGYRKKLVTIGQWLIE